MALKAIIQEDLKKSLIEKKELELSVLRMLNAAIFNKEKEKRYKLSKEKSEAELEKMGKESAESKELEKESQLTDEEIIDVISGEIKKRKEAMDLYEKGGRQELFEKEKKEAEILKSYLPEQMPEEEIKKIIQEAITKTGASEMKDMGKVMGIITAQVKGKADMSQVSQIVKKLLS